jgi:hypothetical protein
MPNTTIVKFNAYFTDLAETKLAEVFQIAALRANGFWRLSMSWCYTSIATSDNQKGTFTQNSAKPTQGVWGRAPRKQLIPYF